MHFDLDIHVELESEDDKPESLSECSTCGDVLDYLINKWLKFIGAI